jgi:hypothetical protein
MFALVIVRMKTTSANVRLLRRGHKSARRCPEELAAVGTIVLAAAAAFAVCAGSAAVHGSR